MRESRHVRAARCGWALLLAVALGVNWIVTGIRWIGKSFVGGPAREVPSRLPDRIRRRALAQVQPSQTE